MSRSIFALLGEYTDTVVPYSIDEAFMDLTGWARTSFEAVRIIHTIKARIREEIGEVLTASVGIARTRFFAKFGSDWQKPDGLTVIMPAHVDRFLAQRSPEAAWGIGPQSARKLQRMGITNLLTLKRQSRTHLIAAFGQYGNTLWANLNGVDDADLTHGSVPPKSVGHSYCIPLRERTPKAIDAILKRLATKTGYRLRELSRQGERLFVAASTSTGEKFSSLQKTPLLLYDSFDIYNTARAYLGARLHSPVLRFLALSVHELKPKTQQLGLFAHVSLLHPMLADMMDEVNKRYGDYTLERAEFLFANKEFVPDRIGFRKTVEAKPYDDNVPKYIPEE